MRDQQAMTGPPSKIRTTPLRIEHFEHNKVWKMSFLLQMGVFQVAAVNFFGGVALHRSPQEVCASGCRLVRSEAFHGNLQVFVGAAVKPM